MNLIKEFLVYILIIASMPIAIVCLLAMSIYNILLFITTEYPRIIFSFAKNKAQQRNK